MPTQLTDPLSKRLNQTVTWLTNRLTVARQRLEIAEGDVTSARSTVQAVEREIEAFLAIGPVVTPKKPVRPKSPLRSKSNGDLPDRSARWVKKRANWAFDFAEAHYRAERNRRRHLTALDHLIDEAQDKSATARDRLRAMIHAIDLIHEADDHQGAIIKAWAFDRSPVRMAEQRKMAGLA